MDDIRRVRPEVEGFEAYTPGLTIDEIKARYGLDSVIKMASNENPLGTSPVVRQVLCDKAGLAFRYAQAGTPRLAAAIGAHHGLPAGRVVVGNGSDEIIDLLVRVKARPGHDNIIAFKPCFAMYKIQARLCGVEFRQAPLGPGFSFDPDALLALADGNTAICFVTTPDNPSGYAPPVAMLERLARELPPQCLLVLDEAYMDFVECEREHSLLPRLEEFPNVAVLRTFSKLYGLAGLRLGYGLLPEWLADYCLRVKPPFSVNILAEEAGLAALRDGDFIRATREAVLRGREYLARELGALGCRVWPSQANFFIMDLPGGAALDAGGVFEALLARGIILRPLASYGMAASLRVSVGNAQENAALVRALAEVLA
jgi:histidinol-phosphate aminotransferase